MKLNFHLDVNDLIKAHNQAFPEEALKIEWPEGRVFRI